MSKSPTEIARAICEDWFGPEEDGGWPVRVNASLAGDIAGALTDARRPETARDRAATERAPVDDDHRYGLAQFRRYRGHWVHVLRDHPQAGRFQDDMDRSVGWNHDTHRLSACWI